MADDKLTPEELQELQELEELEQLEAKEARGELDKAPEQPSLISPTQSAVLGATQGLTLGFSDEILAASETGQEVVKDAFNSFLKNQMTSDDNPSSSISEKYKKHKKSIDDMFNEARLANPGSYLSGDIAGSLASTVLTLGGGSAIKAGSITKSALELSKHAGVGFVHGVGRSEDDTIEGIAAEGLESAALGVAGEAVGPILGKGYGAIKQQAKKTSAGSLIKFLGDKYSTVEQNLSRVGKPVVEWAERLIGYTDDAGKSLVDISVKRKDLLDNFVSAKKSSGNEMGKILKQVDNELKLNIDTSILKQNLKDEFVTPFKSSVIPEDKAVAASLEEYLDSIFENVAKRTENVDAKTGIAIPGKEYAAKEMNLSDLHAIRSSIFKYTKDAYKIKDSIPKTIMTEKRKMAGRLGDAIDDIIETSSEVADSPLFTNYVTARTKYGDLSEGISAIENSMSDQGQSFIQKLFNDRLFAFTSVAGALGSKFGLPHSDIALGAAGLLAIAKSKRVNGAIAKSAQTVADAMQADPDKFAGVASKLVASSSIAGTDFLDNFMVASAEVSLLQEPLARDPQEVLRRADTVLTLLDQADADAADNLRKAIEIRDVDSIGTIMSQMATSLPTGYIQEGMGWGGKAYSEVDKAAVQNYLNGVKNTRKRMLLTTDFAKTGMIPKEMSMPKEEPMNMFIYRKAKDKVRNPEY
jgi:hypothetical protein